MYVYGHKYFIETKNETTNLPSKYQTRDKKPKYSSFPVYESEYSFFVNYLWKSFNLLGKIQRNVVQ